MLVAVILLGSLVYSVHGHNPPPGYYCFLQCLNKCLATPPQVKADDLLEFCKTEVCWPMTPDEAYCDPNRRACFTGSCKPSDVGWIPDKDATPMHTPILVSRRSESTNLWRLEWDPVPGALFYAVHHWKEGDNSSVFYHEEVSHPWSLIAVSECRQHFAQIAAISTTGMTRFSQVIKAYAYLNDSEEVIMKLDMKGASLVSLPYFYDPVSSTPSNTIPNPIEPSTLILTIGYQLITPGWRDLDVEDLIDYAFLPVSCPPSDSSLDLTELKPKTNNFRSEFVLNLPGSIAQRKCKFLFSVKSISVPCGHTVRVVHTLPGFDDGINGLWSTLDCAKIENAMCQDDPRRNEVPVIPRHTEIDEPPRGQDNQELEDSAVPVQKPRNDILHLLDQGVQPFAILLAFVVAVPVVIFWIIRCTICKRPKPITPM